MSQSEKVCKQLGIRPRYLYKIAHSINNRIISFQFENNKPDVIQVLQHRRKKGLAKNESFKVIKVEKIYPDMTQPGNFVKFAEVFPSEIGEIIKDWSLRGMLEKRNLREYTIDRAVNALDDTAELDSDIKTDLDIIEWEY